MNSLRILHVTRDFPPQNSGGLSTAVHGLATSQREAQMLSQVVSFDDFRPSAKGERNQPARMQKTKAGIEVIRVAPQVDLESAFDQAVKLGAQVLHVHSEGLWEFSQRVAKRLGATIVYSVHVLQAEQDRLRGIGATKSTQAQGRALLEADAIHSPSRTVTELLCQSDPTLRSKIHTIPLATGLWPSVDEEREARADLGSPLLLYVGRFADINGFAQFLAALPPLFAERPGLRAIAAGGLPGNERGAQRWRKRWAKMAGDNASRLSMDTWLGRDELSDLYRRATMLVVPSWFETFGQVVLEGMLHGCPIVTTGAGAIGELVDEKSALLIKAQDSTAIREGVLQNLTNPEHARSRADIASAVAHDDYRWASRMPAFRALYGALC